MANFLSTSLKNLFISLGASKTSDNNYAVPLLNATTKEPVGDMTISQLASVLGVPTLIADSDITNIDNVSYGYMWTRFTGNPLSGTFPSGFSTTGSFLLHVTISQRNKVQAIINYDCSHVFVRTWWGTAWMGWKTIV